MSFVHCRSCAVAFDVDRASRCPRCGTFLGAACSTTEQVTACVDRLGALLAAATPDEREALAAGLRATPPCADREATRWTNAVSVAVAETLVPALAVPPPDLDAPRRALALGFWLGVAATLRELAEGSLRRRLPGLRARFERASW